MPTKMLAAIIILCVTCSSPCLSQEVQNPEETRRSRESTPPEKNGTKQDNHYPFAFVIENDVCNQTDNGYTNGFTLSISGPWTRQDEEAKLDFLYHFTDRWSLVKQNNRRRRFTFALIHDIYTPEDLEDTKLIDDDLPYSGLLFGQFLVDYQTPQRADALGFILGMIGPVSQGEWVQKSGHKMVGVDQPEGWDNQIEDELLINLNYTHKWLVCNTRSKPGEIGIDLIPYAGASAGNLLTDAKCGLMARLGNHSPASPSTIYKGRLGSLPDIGYTPVPFTCFILAGLEGSYTFYSVLLDGNIYKHSHQVTRTPESAALFTGIGLGWKKFRLGLFRVSETKRFKEQQQSYSYGSVTLGWLF